jgi:hypothetical protein
MSAFPEWFKQEVGFKFMDEDGDLGVYLGPGKLHDHKCIGTVNIGGELSFVTKSVTEEHSFLYVCLYKGEWFLYSGDNCDLSCCKPWKDSHA